MKKKALLAALLVVLTGTLSGCLIQPDPTLDPLAIDEGTDSGVPFSTSAPRPTGEATQVPVTPTPTVNTWTPSDSSHWEDWSQEGLVTLPTPTPGPQASPTPKPTAWITSQEDYNTGYPVLRVGSTGSDVSDLQTRLKELGYYTGSVDGMFSTGTQAAVIAFQSANGLSADGIAGRATQDKLYSTSAVAKSISATTTAADYSLLKNGSYGTDVRKLQVRLTELGYYNGGADGVYGTATEEAVKAFQRNNGLSADGQAGSATQTRLYSASAKSASKPVTTPDPNQTRTLIVGMEGNDVYAAQARLIELGYLNGVADGVFGTETQAAVVAFQNRNNLTADGRIGPATLKKLNGSAKAAAGASATATPSSTDSLVLTVGSSGEYVYNLQARLYELGYYNGRIDGRFGENTAAAVLSFQAYNGLSADGVAGPATLKKLDSNSVVASNGSIVTNGGNISSGTPSGTVPSTDNGTTGSPANALTTTLSNGATGPVVALLQQNLKSLGYYTGAIDAQYGTSTASAVMLFQQKNGLSADGVAGAATLALLYSGTAQPYETAAPTDAPTAAPTSTPDVFTTLYQGLGGEQVTKLQAQLAELGYLTALQVDGRYGATTVSAVKRFQQKNGLSADGVAGPTTLALLYSEGAIGADAQPDATSVPSITATPGMNRTLKQGDSGEDVRVLQTRLKELGFYAGSIDGQMGPGTVSALKAFQTRNGLTADGVAGAGTQSILYSADALGYAQESVGVVTTISANNQERQKKERSLNGAYQISLSGGGIVCDDKTYFYYANTFDGGALYRRPLSGGAAERISGDTPRFLHATNGRLYYVASRAGTDSVIRLDLSTLSERTALSAGAIRKFMLHDGVFYYLEGTGTLYRMEDSREHLAEGVEDFLIDATNDRVYLAGDGGVTRMRLSDGDTLLLSSHSAEQLALCGEACYFLSGGGIYRIYRDETQLLRTGSVTWMGAYGSSLYYLEGGMIYRCDVNGKDSQLVDGGTGYTRVSISDNMLFVGTDAGYTTIIPI